MKHCNCCIVSDELVLNKIGKIACIIAFIDAAKNHNDNSDDV